MAEHRGPCPALGPVAAGAVVAGGEGRAVGLRAGQDVVLIRHIADAIHRCALLVQRECLVDAVPVALDVAVQIGHVVGDQLSARVVPRTRADAVACVHRRLAALSRHAQIRAPRASGWCGNTAALRHLRAVRVGTSEAAVVGAVTLAHAGDEE